MPSASYSFIDVAVIDGVRERFAAGDALAILSADLDEVIWANGPGAELFGYQDIEAIIGASARIGPVAKRQIMATNGFPHIGTNRGITVRLATGMTSRAVTFLASALTLPDGASAILLAVPAVQAGSRSGTEIAEKAISGFNEPGQFAALVDSQGGVAAAAAGLGALGISGETLASLVAEVAGSKDRIVKRMVRGKSRSYPTGLARLTDDPALHLLVVIDESQLAQEEAAAREDAAAPADAPANDAVEAVSAEATRPVAADTIAEGVSQVETTEQTAVGRPEEEKSAAGDPAADIAEDDAAADDPAEPMNAAADAARRKTGAEAPVESPAQLDGWYFNAAGDAAEQANSESGAPEKATVDAPGGEAWRDARSKTEDESVDPEAAEGVEAGPSPVDRTAAPVRFVWRTDAEGRFGAISQEFEAAVGKPAADVVGRRFRDVAASLGLDPSGEIAGLLDRRDTWSGRSVLWPVAGTDLRIPVDLAALPVYARDRSFEGFRGFGVARSADAIVDPERIGLALAAPAEGLQAPATEADAGPVATSEPVQSDPFKGETPALAIVPKPERRFADKVIRLAEHRSPANDKGLSPVERNAFREIGERLKPALETGPPLSPDLEEETAAEPSTADEAATDADINVATAEQTAPPADDSMPAEALDEAASGDAPETPAAADEPADEPIDASAPAEPEQLSLSIVEDAGSPAADETDVTPVESAAPIRSRSNISLLGFVQPDADTADAVVPPDDAGIEASAEPAESPALGPIEMGTPSEFEAAESDVPTEKAPGDESPEADILTAEAEETHSPAGDAAPEHEDDGRPPAGEAEGMVTEADQIAVESQAAPNPAAEDTLRIDEASGDGSDKAAGEIERADATETAAEDADTADATADENVEASADSRIKQPPEQPTSPPPLRTEGFLPSAFAMGIERRRRVPTDTSILEKLPVPVLIHSGDELHYANPEFLGLTGYGSIDNLTDAGGLGALFADPDSDAPADSADKELWLRTNGGTEFPIEALLRSVPWAGGKALMLVVRRTGDERLVGDAGAMSSPTVAGLAIRVAEMRTIIDTATDGVVLIAPDGAIRSISRPAEALFGFDSDEVAGKPFASLFAIESQRAASDYLAGLSDHGVASVLNDGREVIGRESQGRFIPLFMTIGRLPNDSGYCAVVRDITQWKRAEEDLTQARAIAERSSSQKSEFLARVSHEIRTPLNAIIGFSELMVDEKFGPITNDRYRDYLRDINRSGNHVLDIVNDLLDISKIEAGQQEMDYQAVSLNDTLAETVAMMQPQANRERVIIRSSFASKLPEVVADPRSIRQIALNILSNAIRYTQAGGQVIVSTSYEASGDIVMRVRDTGIGMTQAEIEQALKPFKQINSLKRARGDGTGLGLPLTKAMVEANRARFAISSSPGDGTLVEVVFPSTRVLAD